MCCRNVTFLAVASNKVILISGSMILSGSPGNPAPAAHIDHQKRLGGPLQRYGIGDPLDRLVLGKRQDAAQRVEKVLALHLLVAADRREVKTLVPERQLAVVQLKSAKMPGTQDQPQTPGALFQQLHGWPWHPSGIGRERSCRGS